MRIRLLPCALIAVFLLPAAGAAELEEILASYYEARGGKTALDAVQTVRGRGVLIQPGGQDQAFLFEWKRPNKMRLEITLQSVTEIQAFDGATAWTIEPPDQPDAEPMSPVQLAMLNDGVDFIGPLVDFEAKGNTVELIGEEEIEGTPAHKLKVTKADGMVEMSFLDAEYALEILQVEQYTLPDGSEFALEVTWSDYKEVDGLLLPFSWSRKPAGAPAGMALNFSEIEINPEIPDERFAMPAGDGGS